jgi:hypothetical protein
MKPDQEEVNELGHKLEKIVTDFLLAHKASNELLVGTIAGLSNIMVCAAYAAWGPEFGLECITRAINAASKKWKETEENEGGTETKNRKPS